LIAAEDAKGGPYAPCSCGSGKKFRFCHGNRQPESPFSAISIATIAQQEARVAHVLPQTALPASGNVHGGAK
jgi:hypothetical protein